MFVNLLLQNLWQELFPCLVSKAAIVDVVCNGEGANRNGAINMVIQQVNEIVD